MLGGGAASLRWNVCGQDSSAQVLEEEIERQVRKKEGPPEEVPIHLWLLLWLGLGDSGKGKPVPLIAKKTGNALVSIHNFAAQMDSGAGRPQI